MAETLETIRTRIQDWLSANTVRLPNAQVTAMINIVQRDLARKHDLRFFQTTDTFPTVVSTQAYSLPTGWSRPYRLWYVDSDTNAVVEVENLAEETFDRLYPLATSLGKPVSYKVWGSSLYLGPTPDRVVTITRDYYRFPTDLADGDPTNTNALVVAAWDVLFYGAMVEATAYMMEDPRAGLWEQRYRRAESDLVSEHARAWSSGRVAQSQEPG